MVIELDTLCNKDCKVFFFVDRSPAVSMYDLFPVFIITETSDVEGKKRSSSIDSKLGRGTQLKGNCYFGVIYFHGPSDSL